LAVEKWISGRLPFFEDLDPQQYRLRCLLLGLYHTGVAMLLAVYLYRLGLLFQPQPGSCAVFVLMVFFTTFLWNYLRAHTIDVFQVLFFTAMCYHLVRVRRLSSGRLTDSGVWKHTVLAVLFASVLILSKTFFVLVLPALLLAIATAKPNRRASSPSRVLPELLTEKRGVPFGLLVVLPLTVALGLLFWTNWLRFGNALETGYGQWEPMSKHLSLDLREPLAGFALDPRKSVFLHFPLLAFSLLWLRSFAKQFPWESLFGVLMIVGLGLTVCCFSYWRGDWSYGPRYLLFALPVASLPLLLWLATPSPRKSLRYPYLLAAGLVLAWSVRCQVMVNTLEWFVPFRAELVLVDLGADSVESMQRHPYWTVNRELIGISRSRVVATPFSTFPIQLPTDRGGEAQTRLAELASINYYWCDFVSTTAVQRVENADTVH
jgi:hypothetical protein